MRVPNGKPALRSHMTPVYYITDFCNNKMGRMTGTSKVPTQLSSFAGSGKGGEEDGEMEDG